MMSKKIRSILCGMAAMLLAVSLVSPANATGGDFASLLKQIPYYGDISKCTMTAEQAEAYAKLIEDGIAGKLPFPEDYYANLEDSDTWYWDAPNKLWGYSSYYTTNRANVMLGDFAGDGNPYLYVYSSLVPSNSFEVYGWTDGAVNQTVIQETYDARSSGRLFEAPDGTVKLYTEGSGGAAYYYQDIYSFQNGTSAHTYSTLNADPYNTELGAHSHNGYVCFYDVEPCTLTQMAGYLRQYASIINSSGEQETPAKFGSPMYQAYYDKLMELQQTYGTGEIVSVEFVNSLQNLCFAKLLDFNQDGIEELLTVVGERTRDQWNVEYIAYQVKVFDYQNGVCREIYSESPACGFTDMTEGFYLASKNGINYLMQIFSDGINTTTYAWTYRNGQFVRTSDIGSLHSVDAELYQLNFISTSSVPELLLQCSNTIYYLDSNRGTAGKIAMPTNDKLTVNGVLQNPTVYKINDSNYFKIRDLAAVLNGTSKQFAVGYDAASSSVTATSGQGYAKLDTDLAGAASGSQTAAISNDIIIVNGRTASVEVYKIDGSNYFKLRDLGDALGFDVGWSAEQGIFINTEG